MCEKGPGGNSARAAASDGGLYSPSLLSPLLFLRLRWNIRNTSPPITARDPIPTPTPIPAFAPVLRYGPAVGLVSLDAVGERVGVTVGVTDGLGIGPPGPKGLKPVGALVGTPESLQNFVHPDRISAVIVC